MRTVHYLGKQNIAFRGHPEEINLNIISINPSKVTIQAVNDLNLHEHLCSPMMCDAT